MKLMSVTGLIFVILVVGCSFQFAYSEENPAVDETKSTKNETAGEDENKPAVDEKNPAVEDENKPAGNDEKADPTPGEDDKNKTNEETPKEEEKGAGGENEKNEEENKVTKYVAGVADTCNLAIGYCFGGTSTFTDLKGKSMSTVTCSAVEKQIKCFTEAQAGGADKCTDSDYEKIKDEVCFCPRTAASLVLVAILCVFSTLLGKQ